MRILKILGFIDYKAEYLKNCIVCNKELTGKQRVVCSPNCNYKYYHNSKFYEDKEKIVRLTKKQFQDRVKTNFDLTDEKTKKLRAVVKADIKYLDGTNYKCELCKKPARQMHHSDYDKPLDIIHLCLECHGTIHKYLNWIEKHEARK